MVGAVPTKTDNSNELLAAELRNQGGGSGDGIDQIFQSIFGMNAEDFINRIVTLAPGSAEASQVKQALEVSDIQEGVGTGEMLQDVSRDAGEAQRRVASAPGGDIQSIDFPEGAASGQATLGGGSSASGVADLPPIPAPIPEATPEETIIAQTDVPGAGAGPTVVVKQGDTLWDIAQRELGDPQKWREIAQLNNIPDPDLIQPGMQLQMPAASIPQANPRRA